MAASNPKITKVLVIIAGVLLLIVAAAAVWYVTSHKQSASPAQTAASQNFFPFGTASSTSPATPQYAVIGQSSTQTSAGSPAPRLTLISKAPVSGFVAFDEASTTAVRYVLRSSGNAYEAKMDGSSPTRLTDTTLPKAIDATWISTTSLFIENQTDNGEEYFLGAVTAPSASSSDSIGSLDGETLLPDVSPALVAPAGDNLFYLLPQGNGVEGVESNTILTKKNIVFSSALSEWNISWPNESTVTLATKPSSGVAGYLYFLSLPKGTQTEILDGVPGMTAMVDPTLKDLLYSSSSGSNITLEYEALPSDATQTLPFQTFPEKCTFSTNVGETIYCAVPSTLPQVNYPDAWYQGLVAFSDTFMSYLPGTGNTATIFDPSTLGASVDAVDLSVSPDGKYLFFINRVDESLWALSLQ